MDAAAELVRYANSSSKIDTGLQQFHPFHSSNVMLQKDATVASRQGTGRCTVFSKKRLAIGERLMIEFKTLPTDLPVAMVVGLTLQEPNASATIQSLESLVMVGPPYFQQRCNLADDQRLSTSHGSIPTLDSEEVEKLVRVVIMFEPTDYDPQNAMVQIKLNGWDIGPLGAAAQLGEDPLFLALFFLEPITEVRIIQTQGVLTLQKACRNVIRKQFTVDEIMQMTLPKYIKLLLTSPDY